jgi:NAD(P)-dependent dehydrogenase (short-subunit alcohol dehydrogenase family)
VGDIAVVTGAASGIGAAATSLFVAQGTPVIGVDLAAGESADGLGWVEADVAAADLWPSVVERAKARFGGPPTILVLNAATIAVGRVTEVSDDDWQRVFDVNVFAAVRALRACLPPMIELGRGSIVAVASVNALQAEQGLAAYNASKGALLQLIRTVAVDHAREGIRANVVCPGTTDTPLFRKHLATAGDPVRFLQAREQRNPLGRLLDPSEVARTVLFLAGDDAAGMTGSVLVVDAGLNASFDFRTGEEGA